MARFEANAPMITFDPKAVELLHYYMDDSAEDGPGVVSTPLRVRLTLVNGVWVVKVSDNPEKIDEAVTIPAGYRLGDVVALMRAIVREREAARRAGAWRMPPLVVEYRCADGRLRSIRRMQDEKGVVIDPCDETHFQALLHMYGCDSTKPVRPVRVEGNIRIG